MKKGPKTIKEDAAILVRLLAESDDEIEEFRVWLSRALPNGTQEWTFQIPGGYVNYLPLSGDLDGNSQRTAVENHMNTLVMTRDYPSGTYFTTPWGLYLIHGQRIGKI